MTKFIDEKFLLLKNAWHFSVKCKTLKEFK